MKEFCAFEHKSEMICETHSKGFKEAIVGGGEAVLISITEV